MGNEDETPKFAFNEGRLEDARRLLLNEYSQKPVRRLVQIDYMPEAYDVDQGEHGTECYTEDYGLYKLAGTEDLPIRVLIMDGFDADTVAIVLRRIADSCQRDPSLLTRRSRMTGLKLVKPPEDDPIPF